MKYLLIVTLLILSLVGYGQNGKVKRSSLPKTITNDWIYGYDTIRHFVGDTNYMLKQRIPHEMAMKMVTTFGQFQYDKGGNYSKLHININFNMCNDTLCFQYKDEGYMITAKQIIDLLTKPQLSITDNDSVFEIKNSKGRSILKADLHKIDKDKEDHVRKWQCPKCHKADMELNGTVLTSYPAQYCRTCPECGYSDSKFMSQL